MLFHMIPKKTRIKKSGDTFPLTVSTYLKYINPASTKRTNRVAKKFWTSRIYFTEKT